MSTKVVKEVTSSEDDHGFCYRGGSSYVYHAVIIAACLAVYLRVAASMGKWSGQGTPPTFGDFEAQRSWMALTHAHPIERWYDNSGRMWPLDYPPLTAMHEYLNSLMAPKFEPQALDTNAIGLESVELGNLRRFQVLLADMVVLMSAIWVLLKRSGIESWLRERRAQSNGRSNEESGENDPSLLVIAGVVGFIGLFVPSLCFVDHGHFQFNCVAVGLAVWSINFFLDGKLSRGLLMFVLSVLYKQTMVCLSIGVAWYYLSIRIDQFRGRNSNKGDSGIFGAQTQNMIQVIFLDFVLCLIVGAGVILPVIDQKDPFVSFGNFLSSIFPVKRGLFEDYAPSFWCVFNPILRLRGSTVSPSVLAVVSSSMVVVFSYLSLRAYTTGRMSHSNQPGKSLGLDPVVCMSISAAVYTCFGFLIHEKSVVVLDALLAVMTVRALLKLKGETVPSDPEFNFLILRRVSQSIVFSLSLSHLSVKDSNSYHLVTGLMVSVAVLSFVPGLRVRSLPKPMMRVLSIDFAFAFASMVSSVGVISGYRPVARFPWLAEYFQSALCFAYMVKTVIDLTSGGLRGEVVHKKVE